MILDSFRERKPFPGQDPFVVPYDGAFLLLQTAAQRPSDRHQAVLRSRPDAPQHDDGHLEAAAGQRQRGRQLWAPELHQIGDRWYVYYTASDGQNENHRMYVLEADHPLGPYHCAGEGLRSAATTRGPST